MFGVLVLGSHMRMVDSQAKALELQQKQAADARYRAQLHHLRVENAKLQASIAAGAGGGGGGGSSPGNASGHEPDILSVWPPRVGGGVANVAPLSLPSHAGRLSGSSSSVNGVALIDEKTADGGGFGFGGGRYSPPSTNRASTSTSALYSSYRANSMQQKSLQPSRGRASPAPSVIYHPPVSPSQNRMSGGGGGGGRPGSPEELPFFVSSMGGGSTNLRSQFHHQPSQQHLNQLHKAPNSSHSAHGSLSALHASHLSVAGAANGTDPSPHPSPRGSIIDGPISPPAGMSTPTNAVLGEMLTNKRAFISAKLANYRSLPSQRDVELFSSPSTPTGGGGGATAIQIKNDVYPDTYVDEKLPGKIGDEAAAGRVKMISAPKPAGLRVFGRSSHWLDVAKQQLQERDRQINELSKQINKLHQSHKQQQAARAAAAAATATSANGSVTSPPSAASTPASSRPGTFSAAQLAAATSPSSVSAPGSANGSLMSNSLPANALTGLITGARSAAGSQSSVSSAASSVSSGSLVSASAPASRNGTASLDGFSNLNRSAGATANGSTNGTLPKGVDAVAAAAAGLDDGGGSGKHHNKRSALAQVERQYHATRDELIKVQKHVLLLERLQKVFETERNEHVQLQDNMAKEMAELRRALDGSASIEEVDKLNEEIASLQSTVIDYQTKYDDAKKKIREMKAVADLAAAAEPVFTTTGGGGMFGGRKGGKHSFSGENGGAGLAPPTAAAHTRSASTGAGAAGGGTAAAGSVDPKLTEQVQDLQYQLFYGDSKKDAELTEMREKLKAVTAQLEAAQSTHTELAKTHNRLLSIKDREISDWLFAGDVADAL